MHHHGQDCLKLRVDVAGNKGVVGKSHVDKSKAEEVGKSFDGGKVKFPATGGVHNPSNRLPAGEESHTKYQTDAKQSQQGRVSDELSWVSSETEAHLPLSLFSPQMTLL